MTRIPDSPPIAAVISCLSKYSIGAGVRNWAALTTASAVWPTANLGIFVPFAIPAPFLCKYGFVINGAAVSGNIDIGVFTPDGGLVCSTGSTAHATTSDYQKIAMATAALLPAGSYFMAIAISNTTGTTRRLAASVLSLQACGVLQAASQVPLASGPTFATPANAYLPAFGIASINTF